MDCQRSNDRRTKNAKVRGCVKTGAMLHVEKKEEWYDDKEAQIPINKTISRQDE